MRTFAQRFATVAFITSALALAGCSDAPARPAPHNPFLWTTSPSNNSTGNSSPNKALSPTRSLSPTKALSPTRSLSPTKALSPTRSPFKPSFSSRSRGRR